MKRRFLRQNANYALLFCCAIVVPQFSAGSGELCAGPHFDLDSGLAAARARGRVGGRPKGLSKKAQHKAMLAKQLYLERELSVSEICEQLSISKGTLYNYLHRQGVEVGRQSR